MRTIVEAQLAALLDAKLVRELLDAHAEAKRNYYLGGLRLTEVEGGRFCEAAFRILEQIAWNQFTKIGKQIDTDKLIERLRNLPSNAHTESVRLHIPRALRLVYDIRNNRDAAHLADGIDPNKQDATLVVSAIDWVLAELIRLYHNISADAAHRVVDDIVERVAPIIQDFAGFLKVLNPSLGVSDFCLALLYHRGSSGATFAELETWVRPTMQKNLRRTLTSLDKEKDLVHFDGARFIITRRGQIDAEKRRILGGG